VGELAFTRIALLILGAAPQSTAKFKRIKMLEMVNKMQLYKSKKW